MVNEKQLKINNTIKEKYDLIYFSFKYKEYDISDKYDYVIDLLGYVSKLIARLKYDNDFNYTLYLPCRNMLISVLNYLNGDKLEINSIKKFEKEFMISNKLSDVIT